MSGPWIVTPQFFEHAEPDLVRFAPEGSVINGPHAIGARDRSSMALIHEPIAEFLARALRQGQRPVSLAGDCCAAVPALAGCQRAGLSPWLVWIDAHGDFNTPETSPSQFLGGMPLAMIAGRGPQWMCESVGLKTLPEDRILLIDARDLDPLEAEAVAASGMRHVGAGDLAEIALDGPVLLHLDMDVIDAAEAPAFNYPVEGGPSSATLASVLSAFASVNDIRAISVSAWSPSKDDDGRTGDACSRVLAAITG